MARIDLDHTEFATAHTVRVEVGSVKEPTQHRAGNAFLANRQSRELAETRTVPAKPGNFVPIEVVSRQPLIGIDAETQSSDEYIVSICGESPQVGVEGRPGNLITAPCVASLNEDPGVLRGRTASGQADLEYAREKSGIALPWVVLAGYVPQRGRGGAENRKWRRFARPLFWSLARRRCSARITGYHLAPESLKCVTMGP